MTGTFRLEQPYATGHIYYPLLDGVIHGTVTEHRADGSVTREKVYAHGTLVSVNGEPWPR